MCCQIPQYRMIVLCHLYHHFSSSIFSSGAAAHLLHQLKGAFIHPEIGKAQQAIGIQDSYQIYIFKIKTLHHHLRSHQNIDPLLFELLDQIIMRLFSPDTVNIHTCDLGFREKFFQLFFNFFCSKILLDELVASTGHASMHMRINCSAIMAMQFIGIFMKARDTSQYLQCGIHAADLANLVRRISSPVLKQDHLFIFCKRLLQWHDCMRLTHHDLFFPVFKIFFGIDNFDSRQLHTSITFIQIHQSIFSALCIIITFNRRSGASQQNFCLEKGCIKDSGIPGIVTGSRILLLV